MSRNRRRLKRAARWTAAAVLLVAAYFASAPIAFFLSARHFQRAVPALVTVYSPTIVYTQNQRWPGCLRYREYCQWIQNKLDEQLAGPYDINVARDTMTQVEFTNCPLHVIAKHLSKSFRCPIDLAPNVDGEIQLTMTLSAQSGPLRDILERLLEPHGLVAALVGKGMVVCKPADVQSLIAEADANARKRRSSLIVLGSLGLIVAFAVLLLRRSGFSRRAGMAETSAVASCMRPSDLSRKDA